ncbi:MAG TPA: hypothetical protein PLB05_08680 [Candidatus Omnitrophota bacterium]|nr:hypothetical protein [Candidatus Omnitrophota bacterium]
MRVRSKFKGRKEYALYKAGVKLTRKKAIYALCYMCSDFSPAVDCIAGGECPVYFFSPYAMCDRLSKKHKEKRHAEIYGLKRNVKTAETRENKPVAQNKVPGRKRGRPKKDRLMAELPG